MSQSLSAELRALKEAAARRPPIDDPPPDRWIEVCCCGHLKATHSTAIGGSHEAVTTRSGQRFTSITELAGCCGQALSRHDTKTRIVSQENPTESAMGVKRYRITTLCVCDEFRPVLQVNVNAPHARFNQRPAPKLRRGGDRRDPDPTKHALIKGIRAVESTLRRSRKLTSSGLPDDEIDRLVQKMLDTRIRWIDRRCWADGCGRTDGVWPVYLDGDRSELRCSAHRP